MKLKKYFRSFFPYNCDPYCMFRNIDSGAFELVSRSGHVLLTVPKISCLTDEEHEQLFRSVVEALDDSIFGQIDNSIAGRFCLAAKTLDLHERFGFEPDYVEYSEQRIHSYCPSGIVGQGIK